MYELTGVSKVYRSGARTVEAVAGVDFTVTDGEWVAIRGRTGHGKSTLLNLLGGLDRPTSGQVRLDGRDLGRLSDAELTRVRAAAIGFIFQTFNLVPTLSAAENVEAALIPLRVSGAAQRRRRVAAALDSVGLADRARHLPSELSGGQQQRVAIARALVKEPVVLLADEPTGNLDAATGEGVIALFRELHAGGMTLLIVTHEARVSHAASRVLVLREGKLTPGEEGT